MTPQIALWVLSTLGAVLFFGLGWVSSVMRRPSVQAAGAGAAPLPLGHDEAALERAEATVAELRGQLEAQDASSRRLQQERDELAADLRASQAKAGQVDALTRQLEAERVKQADAAGAREQLQALEQRHERDKRTLEERARTEADKLRKEIASLRASASQSTASRQAQGELEGELARARKEAESARASAALEVKRMDGELRDARAKLEAALVKVEQLQGVRQELERARQELAGLRDQNARASEAEQEVSQLGATMQALKLELSQTQSRLAASDEDRDRRHALVEENERLRADVERAAEIEEQDRQLRQKLQALEARAEEAEALREHNAELRDQLRELQRFEQEVKQLEALETALRAAKLDNEMLKRRIEEAGSDPDSRLELRQQLEEASRRAAEADALQRRVEALEARLFALDLELPEEAPRSRTHGHHEAELEDGPVSLVKAGAKTAVLADNAGLPLASAGIAEHHESLAALSGLALEFADRVRSLLPLSGIRVVRLVDERRMNVYWSIFDSHGDRYALSGVGDGVPEDSLFDDAVSRAQGAVDRAGGIV